MNTVIKRDGRRVPFDRQKIQNAINGAFQDVKQQDCMDNSILARVMKYIDVYNVTDKAIAVEKIQDIVERVLMEEGYYNVAKAYIRYRYEHELERQKKKQEDFDKAISSKLFASDVQNQNANVDEHSFGGRMGEVADEVLREYALNHLMSKMSRDNHLNNEIYIHDLSHYALGDHNCLSIPFDKLLANGFSTRQTDVRPANSVNTAFQLVAVIFQLQSLMQFGGVSATHIDWTMVPYVRKSFRKHYVDGLKYCEENFLFDPDKYIENIPEDVSIEDDEYKLRPKAYKYAMDMTTKETHQAVEGMYHNLNTLQSRSGNQLPFTSINYGTCTLPEGRMVIKALLEVSIEGLGKLHRTSIFPCGIFQVGEGINKHPGDPNYDMYRLALTSTAKRLYPNYANIDWSVNKGYDKNDPCTYMGTMGCRTYNGFDINGFGQRKDGRGNICPVTIILPTLAMEANCDVEEFMTLLDKKIHEAKDMLIERFDWICSQSPDAAKFMWENGTMEGYIPEEGIRSAMKHGTLAVGQIALAETLQLLIGTDQTTADGMELAKRIESLFQKRCKEFKEQYKLNFGVYYTPESNI